MDIVTHRFAPHTAGFRPGVRPHHDPSGRQGVGTRSRTTVAYLEERDRALEPFGWSYRWTGRRAEWVALACLHDGIITWAQWTRFPGCHHEQVHRAVHALVPQGVAVEERPVGLRDTGRSVPHPWAVDLPRGQDGMPSPPQDHFQGDTDTMPPLARLRARPISTCRGCRPNRRRWPPLRHSALSAGSCAKWVHHGASGNLRRCFPVRVPVVLDADRALIHASGPPRCSAPKVPSTANSGRHSGIAA